MSEFENNNPLNNNEAYSDKVNNAENNAFNTTVNTDNESIADSDKLPEYSFIAEQLQACGQTDTNRQTDGNNMSFYYNQNYQPQGYHVSGAYQAQEANRAANYQGQRNEVPGSYQQQGAGAPGGYQPQGAYIPAGYQPQGSNIPSGYQTQGYNPTNSYQTQAGNSAPGNVQPQGTNASNSYQPQGVYTQGNYQPQGSSASSGYQPQNRNQASDYQPQYYPDYSQQYNNTNNPYGNYYNQYNNDRSKKIKKDRKPRRITRFLQLVGKAVCFGLIAGIGFFGFHKLYSIVNPGASIQNVINAIDTHNNSYEIAYTKPASITVSDKSIVSEVINSNLQYIVSITSVKTTDNWFGQSYEVPGSGSGIIVGKTETEILVATNNHVVEGAQKITMVFVDGKEADGILKGADVAADLAVVAIDIKDISKETLEKITVAKLGNSDEVKVGEMAIAIGNALGYGQSATVGYISAKDREVEVSDGYFKTKKMILLQTDAAINPGNSGGALLNSKGEVIGINSVKYATEEVEGMGFAIPISTATPIINELMSREILSPDQQGFLGISGGDVTEDAAAAYNMPVGVFVNEVVENGPAHKAGLLSGDIIIKVDEIKVTAITQLREYVNSRRVGTEVKVTYMRYDNGTYKEHTVTVTLGKNPNLTE